MKEFPVEISEACTGCGICVNICPFGAICLDQNKAVIIEGCKVCGECVDSCPFDAISIKEVEKVELSDYKGVLIFAEQWKSFVHPVAYELLGIGKKLSDTLKEPLYAVIIGNNIENGAKELISRGAEKVYYYDDPLLEDFRDDPYADLLTEICDEIKPSIFLVGATFIGRSLGPKVAAKLKTGLTADCTVLNIDEETGLLLQTRPAYGGNIMATIITPSSRPQMATVRYKMMSEAKKIEEPIGELIKKDVDVSTLTDRIKIVGFEKIKEQISITDADIIVSGGKGLGESKGFEVIKQLASVLGGAVGASRPTVDEGWIDYRHQVGLSGRNVRPTVYLACGISGAVQHQAGMKSSDIIIAINKDPEAQIFKISTLGVVGDLYEVIPRLIKMLKENSKND
jgi:electron transfer flavoprotein alpha subunit